MKKEKKSQVKEEKIPLGEGNIRGCGPRRGKGGTILRYPIYTPGSTS